MWIYVESDYATQGVKKPVINAYAGSSVKSVVERFANKLIEISNYRTVVVDKSSSITEAFVSSNKDAYNVSWIFQTGEAAVASNNATSINASDKVLLIIDSNYSISDVYNTSLFVNSSSVNESVGGVIIT